MACQRPNLQNLPRDPRYRACFGATPGRVLVKADYSQIEVRFAAEISGDKAMLRGFANGADFHSLVAAQVSGKPIANVTKDERQLAKALNFGLIYGMGARRLADYAGQSYGVALTEEQAADIRQRYFQVFAGLRAWHNKQTAPAVTESRTIAGRRRKIGPADAGLFSKLLNSPIQGSAADGLKLALALLWETPGPADAYPVLTVHDEIVIDAPADKAAEAKAWLEGCMTRGMAEYLKQVPVAVETSVKDAW